MLQSLHGSIIAYQTMGAIALGVCSVFFVCFIGVVIMLKSNTYKEYMHSKKMLELEKEKEAQIEEYKQLVKELREKVEKI